MAPFRQSCSASINLYGATNQVPMAFCFPLMACRQKRPNLVLFAINAMAVEVRHSFFLNRRLLNSGEAGNDERMTRFNISLDEGGIWFYGWKKHRGEKSSSQNLVRMH